MDSTQRELPFDANRKAAGNAQPCALVHGFATLQELN